MFSRLKMITMMWQYIMIQVAEQMTCILKPMNINVNYIEIEHTQGHIKLIDIHHS